MEIVMSLLIIKFVLYQEIIIIFIGKKTIPVTLTKKQPN